MSWFLTNLMTISVGLTVGGAGLMYLAGTLDGGWSIVVGMIAAALTGAGVFGKGKAPAPAVTLEQLQAIGKSNGDGR